MKDRSGFQIFDNVFLIGKCGGACPTVHSGKAHLAVVVDSESGREFFVVGVAAKDGLIHPLIQTEIKDIHIVRAVQVRE